MPVPTVLTATSSLLIVLLLVLAAARAARRVLGPTPRVVGGTGRPVVTVVLDARRRLHVVEVVGGGRALVLTGGPNDALLAWPGAASGDMP